ncbi:hypothetical protein ES703_57514 [subsurface metagenome]
MQWLIDIAIAAMKQYLKGMIVIWSGAEVDIPDGWQLCNGTNGTPDLTDRFVRAPSVARPIGTIGGAGTHSHTVDSHRHLDYRSLIAASGATRFSPASDYTGYQSPGTSSEANIPPYYALAYIMKL